MVFAGIVIVAIIMYIRGFKIPALLIFFFYLTSGFNLVPEEVTKIGFITKGSDYAFAILVIIFIIDSLFVKGYLNRDNFTKYLIIFASFLIICIFYSKFVIKLGWGDILRTCRYQFFWVIYFLFRSLKKDTLEILIKCLFFITICTSIIYLLQIILDKSILLEAFEGSFEIFGIILTRFYNQPDMLFFFTFMAIYHNPLKGIPKYLTMIIFTLALLGAYHRSLMGFFFVSIIVGYVVCLPYIKRIRFITVASIFMLFVVVFWGYKFVNSRSYLDIKYVLSGDVADTNFDMENLGNATFTFRVLHLLERNQYLLENPKAMIFGAGLMPEDSNLVGKMFDFKIGLIEELTGEVVQLDTGDISYSILILRLGYLGTFLYLMLIVYLMVFFYKNKENKYGLFSLLYLILAIGVSFFSSNLISPINYILPLISYHIIKKTDPEITLNETSTNENQ